MNRSTRSTDEDRDRRLAELLGRLTDERGAGREPDVEAAARRHPDLADELRELWAAAPIAEELAAARPRPTRPGAWPSPAVADRPAPSAAADSSASTSCWRSWAGAGWGWSTGPGSPTWAGSWR